MMYSNIRKRRKIHVKESSTWVQQKHERLYKLYAQKRNKKQKENISKCGQTKSK